MEKEKLKIDNSGTTNNYEELLWSNPKIQGGQYCLKKTRISIVGIIEALPRNSLEEITRTLKKYFGYSISVEKLREAISQYETKINLISMGYL